MTAKLIILRGNSGSGKTTIAKELQNSFQRGKAMVVSQDEIRLGILNTKDRKDNPAIELIRLIAEYGKNHCEYVIVEGILGNNKYRDMLIELMIASIRMSTCIILICLLMRRWCAIVKGKNLKILVQIE